MSDELTILVNALKLSEGVGKDFTDLNLAKASGQEKKTIQKFILDNKNSNIFRKTHLNNFICLDCGVESERCSNGEAICKQCGTILQDDNLADFQLNLKMQEAENIFRAMLIEKFGNLGYKNSESKNSFIKLSNGSERLFFRVGTNHFALNDYYALRGWQGPQNLDLYLLVCYSADVDLIALSQKDPRCILIPITNIVQNDFLSTLGQIIAERKGVIQNNHTAESIAGLNFQDYFELTEVKNKLNTIVDELPKLALQQGDSHSGKQGRDFQKYIITLLNLTLFRAKYLGGNNQPDGLIQLLESSKNPTWIPIEIKTFKPKKNTFFEVKDVSGQLDKYSKAFEKQEISNRVSTPVFLTIAFDFDLSHNQGDDVIDELERNHSIRYSFMPLSSLVHLLNLFLDKKICVIPNDVLLDFVKQNRLITKDKVDKLFERLEQSQDIDNSILSQFRKHVSAQGI